MVCRCVMETSPRGFPSLVSPPPLPAVYKSLSIKYCLEGPFSAHPYSGTPCQAKDCKLSREKRENGQQAGAPTIYQPNTVVGHSFQQCSGSLGRQCSQSFLATESTVQQEFPLLGCRIPEVGRQSRGESLSFLILWFQN